jgi:hypothetical protein
VSQFLFLDSGPLGLLTHPQRSAEVIAITDWLSHCLLSGTRVIVPAIVYYELKRELLRAKKTFSVGRLDDFSSMLFQGATFRSLMKPCDWPPNFGRSPGKRAVPPPNQKRSTSMS